MIIQRYTRYVVNYLFGWQSWRSGSAVIAQSPGPLGGGTCYWKPMTAGACSIAPVTDGTVTWRPVTGGKVRLHES